MRSPRGVGPFRRCTHLARWFRRKCRARQAWLVKERADLEEDLSRWTELATKRQALFDAAEARGDDWLAQAEAQALPVNAQSFALYNACAKLIAKRGLRRGVPFWRRSHLSHQLGTGPPCSNWQAYERATTNFLLISLSCLALVLL